MADASSGVFDMDRIRRLVELMKEHDLREVDLQEGDQKIRLSRGAKEVAYAAPPMMASAAPATSHSTPSAPPPSAGPAPDAANIKMILSPMVGTYYSKPNPNSESFVKVGDHVETNTTVCIIEAMK